MSNISRRQFLGSSGLGAAAALTLSAATAAAGAKPKESDLPPSIAALTSRRHEATPITRQERMERHERARRLMAAQGLDAIVMSEGTSLVYFTGIHWWPSERLLAAVLTAKGEAFYVCPAFEEGRAREQLASSTDAERADVRVWHEDENPYERVAQGLRDRGIATGRVGLEETMRFMFSDGISKAAPQLQIQSAKAVTAGCRMIKSPHELALMKLASEVTLQAYEAGYKAARVGMTHHELSELTRVAHERLGFEGAADLVLTGEWTAFPHGSVTPQVIREDSIILFDGGCTVEGYQSDLTRTFVLGKATPKMRTVFNAVKEAQSAALAAARPGAACGSVDAAARAVITAAGFGPDYKHFTHRLGHGIGMDGHEWPYLVRGNQTPLEVGMTTSNEPGVYIRGEFGIRLEDDMHVTEDGARLFTPQSRSLEEPFARG